MRFPYLFIGLVAISTSVRAEPWVRHIIDASSRGADGVRFHDVNGDGLVDIATPWEEGGNVRVYLHPGPGRVTLPWPAVTVGQVQSPEDAVFADVDGDGSVDVVSACEGNTRTVFVHWAPSSRNLYLTADAWKTEAVPATNQREAWMFTLPMDIDGQQGVDLVVGSKGNNASISWLRSPRSPRNLGNWKLQRLRDCGWIMSLQALDMDGDGDEDILASDRKGPAAGIFWLENPGAHAAGHGAHWQEHSIEKDLGEVMFLTVGDLNQDGHRDVLTAVRGGPLAFLQGTGNAAFPWDKRSIDLPSGVGTGKGVGIGDINGDGRQDVVFTCENANGPKSGVRWMSNLQADQSSRWLDHEIGGPEGHKYDRLELADMDGDDDLDVVTCEERDNLGLLWYENPRRRSPTTRSRSSARPNILLIVADDLSRECLGAYGGTSYETPNLDALASAGIRFVNCFSPPTGVPSRLTLLTGRYTFRTTEEPGQLPEEEKTIGEVLQKARYTTALAGKWEFQVPRNVPKWWEGHGFTAATYWATTDGSGHWRPKVYQNGQVCYGVVDRYGPEVYSDFLVDFIRRHTTGPARQRPFFAYYPMTLPRLASTDAPTGPRGRPDTFAEMVSAMDRQVGKLANTIRELDLERKTLIVFTAENGSPQGVISRLGSQRVRGGKGDLQDGGTRVPLIATWVGTTPPGVVNEDLVDLSDLLPTFLEVARGAPPGVVIDGRSFAPQLRGQEGSPRQWVYTQWEDKRWIRDSRWKLYSDGRLVDVVSDPNEASPTQPETDAEDASEARRRLQRILNQFKL